MRIFLKISYCLSSKISRIYNTLNIYYKRFNLVCYGNEFVDWYEKYHYDTEFLHQGRINTIQMAKLKLKKAFENDL